ncbi:MAG: hypothetical protein LIO91_07415 [Bacteroidales bacterium]|nr:hypothetical protein [Bacteroidales bacterium]
MIAQWMLKRLKRLDRALALPIVILLAFMAQDAVAQSSWRYLRPQQIKNVEPVVPPLEVDTTLDVSGLMFPSYYYGPVVYDHYIIFDSVPQFPVPELKISTKEPIPDSLQAPEPRPVTAWVDDRLASAKKFWELRQRYMINHPDQVKYNTLFLPRASQGVSRRRGSHQVHHHHRGDLGGQEEGHGRCARRRDSAPQLDKVVRRFSAVLPGLYFPQLVPGRQQQPQHVDQPAVLGETQSGILSQLAI